MPSNTVGSPQLVTIGPLALGNSFDLVNDGVMSSAVIDTAGLRQLVSALIAVDTG
jgi:hypothetical protein